MKKAVLIGVFIFLASITTFAQELLFPSSLGFSGAVNATDVNIRKNPNLSSSIIDTVDINEVRILGQDADWYQIKYEDDLAWINSAYVETQHQDCIPNTFTKAEQIINYGLNFIGTPYVWGGNSLTRGVDCSGFTKEVYDAFGITISRVSYQQANDGNDIDKAELKTGDLVFFDTNGSNNGNISHVGIYMNNNKFIHSASTNGVMISNLNSPYYAQNYVKSVRILK
ncbi:glycoside hydrolase [Epulopiscium sp. SCG-B10WGA-EpuloA2]|nr:glycoside hydrolase [Epulopiscium sp. SCG-B10WGA-EpuloA2]